MLHITAKKTVMGKEPHDVEIHIDIDNSVDYGHFRALFEILVEQFDTIEMTEKEINPRSNQQ